MTGGSSQLDTICASASFDYRVLYIFLLIPRTGMGTGALHDTLLKNGTSRPFRPLQK